MVCMVNDAGASATAEHFACTQVARRENQVLLGLLKSLEEGEHGQQWPIHLSLTLLVLLAAWHSCKRQHGREGSWTLRRQHVPARGSAADPERCTCHG